MNALLARIQSCRLFRPLDVQVARLLTRIDDSQCPELPLLAALASWTTGQGHTCLPLSEAVRLLAGTGLEHDLPADLSATLRALQASPAVGRADEARPLVLICRDG